MIFDDIGDIAIYAESRDAGNTFIVRTPLPHVYKFYAISLVDIAMANEWWRRLYSLFI